jgi:hypothetical protein
MAFVIKKEHSYIWPIIIYSPRDGGDFDKYKINVKFLMANQKKIEQSIKDAADGNSDFLDDVLAGWTDESFKDDMGNPIQFNNETKEIILDNPIIRNAILSGYLESVNGKAVARKN